MPFLTQPLAIYPGLGQAQGYDPLWLELLHMGFKLPTSCTKGGGTNHFTKKELSVANDLRYNILALMCFQLTGKEVKCLKSLDFWRFLKYPVSNTVWIRYFNCLVTPSASSPLRETSHISHLHRSRSVSRTLSRVSSRWWHLFISILNVNKTNKGSLMSLNKAEKVEDFDLWF